jgi:hypothetical protein
MLLVSGLVFLIFFQCQGIFHIATDTPIANSFHMAMAPRHFPNFAEANAMGASLSTVFFPVVRQFPIYTP